MNEITLKDFLKSHTQKQAAKIIGCSQGAVHQMILYNRDIRIVTGEDGLQRAYEIKQLIKA